jgi:hypothetical protein
MAKTDIPRETKRTRVRATIPKKKEAGPFQRKNHRNPFRQTIPSLIQRVIKTKTKTKILSGSAVAVAATTTTSESRRITRINI